MQISLNNFSSNYKEVLVKSIDLAVELQRQRVITEYLLYALLKQKGSVASTILQKTTLKPEGLEKYLIKNEDTQTALPQLAQETISLIEQSAIIAQSHNHHYIGTEHLLFACIDSKDEHLLRILNDNNVNTNFIKQQLKTIFSSSNKFQDLVSSFNPNDPVSDISRAAQAKSVLEGFTTNLTDQLIQKNIDPVIGRKDEIIRLIEILMRRTKNNPLILGDPGVGKTAIVEGLAKKIIESGVPDFLIGKQILSLDLGLLVAGTMFRGEFENRMKQIIEEVKQNPNIIVFIDEIHNIIGAGSTQGSMDVANILKPALARGEIRCIGATTYEEYKKYIEGDAALERRFQLVKINEPSTRETITILEGIKDNYEVYHNVSITDEAIAAAARLSDKYISDRFLPDKAIDLIDEAASKVRINQKPDPLTQKVMAEEQKLKEVVNQKQEAILEENFKRAISLKKREEELLEEIDTLRTLAKDADVFNRQKITKKDVCAVLSKITGIPLTDILAEERKKLLGLEENLGKYIVGQKEALTTIAQTIRKSKSGVSAENKPLGSFIFIGTSGTGKTYTAKMLGELLFQDKESLIKIDMSEFSEKFNISKLIGAPAGYVGYKESGKLTDAVKRKPYSIVLFDEIEKAHPDIFNLLLQILDEGYLTDAIGKKIDFRNTIIIMTSNLGVEKLDKIIGFNKEKESIQQDLEQEIKSFFRPEFINRVDNIVVFNSLTKHDCKEIAELELRLLQKRLKKQKITLTYPQTIMSALLKEIDLQRGARSVKRQIEKQIEAPLSDMLLTTKKKKFTVLVKNKSIVIS